MSNRSRTYPDVIPTAYSREDLADAYRMGWNHGHGIACHNVPELGAAMHLEDMGRIIVDADNVREVYQSLCFTAEHYSRDYSPFEHTAHAFNSAEDDEDTEGQSGSSPASANVRTERIGMSVRCVGTNARTRINRSKGDVVKGY